MVQDISRVVGNCVTKIEALCEIFVDMGVLVKTQVKNGLDKLFDFCGQKNDMSDQAIFTLADTCIHDEE